MRHAATNATQISGMLSHEDVAGSRCPGMLVVQIGNRPLPLQLEPEARGNAAKPEHKIRRANTVRRHTIYFVKHAANLRWDS